ncbi:MAG: hypothetical protein KF833_12530 [Verrucomicrobiae bacterium]|nr:hypothetical protein [Verrucomicrobiae bacterium]
MMMLVLGADGARGAGGGPVRVFVLAGQSNMEGQAVVDLGGRDYNDGKGTLAALLANPATASRYPHLRDASGQWTQRDDVWVHYQREGRPLLAGPLGVGYSIYGGRHHFGPELQLGHVLGDAMDEQVLLIKTAWGGRSLNRDFRPPSSGGETGAYYRRMIAQVEAGSPVRFDPVIRAMEGWTVRVDPALLEGEHAEEGAEALAMLANHLQRIRILVQEPQRTELQRIGIWIEHDHPRLNSMQYHPSRRWLVVNRHDPRLAKHVHITQARALLSRAEMLKHPAVILHELAHGYHDQVLGFEHPEILAAYERARAAGNYERVLLYTGERVRHYGLTNHKEYFAEGTEAYFYRNDFHPFVRAELKEFDPELHDLLERIWGSAR